jgi:hypothetical protein
LLNLLQTKETYRSGSWAGSGDPRPAPASAAGAALFGVRRLDAAFIALESGSKLPHYTGAESATRGDHCCCRTRATSKLARRVAMSPNRSRVTEIQNLAREYGILVIR